MCTGYLSMQSRQGPSVGLDGPVTLPDSAVTFESTLKQSATLYRPSSSSLSPRCNSVHTKSEDDDVLPKRWSVILDASTCSRKAGGSSGAHRIIARPPGVDAEVLEGFLKSGI
ncbi:hypothetical protein Salat_2475100 [Sesamum alatum]|uniref:Uncharacterized protein n=1 Tax=Sesamum alatum TaxID=300844 RepID=A0AAE2CBZ0_9LAMI|nr:hypothetical protein Salat_2475100 [Sesamum alatum]